MKPSRNTRRILTTSIAAALASLIAPQSAKAASGTWNIDANGNWSLATNWLSSAIADGATFTANFNFNITADRTITLDTVRTIGNLVFTDATTVSNNFILAGTNILTLDVATGQSSISATQAGRTASVNVPLAGNDGIILPTTSLGIVSLGSNNSAYTGQTIVSSGATLQLGAGAITAGAGGSAVASNTSLGLGGVGSETVVQAGGVLNINAQNTGNLEIVRIAGFGNATLAGAALLNNGGGQNNALSTVVLTGDAAIGGTGRFDIRNNVPLLDLGGFRLTKIGGNQFSVVGGSITAGNIDVNAGLFAIESDALVRGAGSISLNTGGTLALWNNVSGRQTRTIVLAGGSINEQGSASLTSTNSSPVMLANNAAINVGGTATTMFTMPGNITQTGGNFGITKTGGGTLALAGANTWTGPLTINDASGRVNLNSTSILSARNVSVGTASTFDASALGGYTIPNGGTFTVGTAGVTAGDVIGNFSAGAGTTLNVGPVYGTGNTTLRTASFANNLTLDGATVGNVAIAATSAAPGAANGRLNVLGNLSLSGVTNVNIVPQNGQDYVASGGFIAGTTILANYAGTLTGSAANLAVGNAAEYRQTFSFDTTSVANQVLLNVSGTANTGLTWDNGAANGRWDVNSSANWTGDKFYNLDKAVFTATGAGNVNIVGTVRPSAVNFAGGTYTIGGNGIISGPASVTKSGADRTAITGEFHDFSGGTLVTSGTLAVPVYGNNGGVSSVGTGGVVLDGGAALLEYTGGTATANRTTQLGAGGAGIKVANPLAFFTLSTAISDSTGSGSTSRTLTKTGPGALVLSAAPTFSGGLGAGGGIVVSEGVLRAGIANMSGKSIDVAAGATFDPNGFNGNTAGVTRPTLNIIGNGVPGQAAIWNGGGAQTNTSLFGRINLIGDASIGSPVRYDLNGGTGTDSAATAGVTFNANTFSVQLVGTGERWWAPNLGAVVNDMLVLQGRLGVQQSNNMASHGTITSSAIYVATAGEMSTFGENTTNIKAVVLSGGTLSSTGGGTSLSGVWRGGVTLNADSFLDNRGTAVANNITITSDLVAPTVAPLTLNGATLEKLGSSGTVILSDTGATGIGSGDGTLRIYNGAITMRGGFKMDGAGQVRLQNFGQLNLDDTAGAVTLTKTVKLDGGTLNNAVGSHSTGGIVVGAHGRIFNSAAGTTLTLGNIAVGANNGIQFGTTGAIALSSINSGAPVVGIGNRLGVNWTAGAAPASAGFATWDGVSIGTLAPTVTNSATPTAADDALYTAATTLSGSVTTNTLVSGADVVIPTGALLTIQSGGIVMRGADHSINTPGGGTGRLTTGSADGRLVVNAPEVIDSRGALHIRAQMVDSPLAGGAFRPMTVQKNGPGVATNWGTDNGGFQQSNLYSGGTIINGGRVVPNGVNALGTGNVTVNDGGQLGLFNLSGSTAADSRASYLHNNIILTGRGAGENAGYLGAIRMSGNTTLSGNMSVSDVTRIHNQNGGGNIASLITGSGTIQHTGNNVTWVTNPGSTFNGVTELGYRDQTGAIQVLVSKLANGGLPSSLGASSNAASNLVFNISPILRYVGNGDSTDRLFTLAGGFNIGGTPNSILDGGGYGAVNFTNTGSLEFGAGSYRQLVLRANILNTGANVAGGQLPLNTFAPSLGDPTDHGFGQLVKDGPGRWAITADHTYSGITSVNDGILILGNGGTSGNFGNGATGLGPNQVNIANNASVHLNHSNNFSIPNTIVSGANGNNEVVQIGSGTATLSGFNDNGSTRVRVESGVVELGKASNVGVHALALLGTVNGGTLRLGGTGDDQIFDGATSGIWTTLQMNGGQFDMNGRNEAIYRIEGNGGTILNSAAGTTSTLTLGGSLLGVGNGSSINGGGLGSTIVDGGGTMALTKVGTGRINLTGTNSFSGVTTVNNGVLALGNGGTSGTLGSGPVVTGVNGTLAIDRSDVFTLANPVSGTGSLTQQGRGTTVVNGGLTYSGVTTVNAGTLRVDLSANSNVLPTAARLTLNGGNVLFDGGLSQTVSSLYVAGGDVNVDGSLGATTLNLPATFTRMPGGSVNFRTTGAGVINSAIANVTNIVGTGNAAYATFNGTDWASGTGAGIVALAPGGYTADTYAPGTHTDVVAGGSIAGGNTATIRFNTPATALLTNTGALVLDQGGILVTPAMAAGSAIAGGTITGGATAGNEVIIHQHTTGGIASATQIASAIVDNGVNFTGLTKAGPGIAALTGANTYSGETHVNQGVLSVGAFGTAGALGTGPVYNDATLAFARTDIITVNNSIGGSGQVVQTGGGTVRLAGTNTFTGGLVIANGTVTSDRGFGGGANTTSNLFSLGASTTLALANTDPASGAGIGTVTLGDSTTGVNNVAFLSDAGADFANPITVTNNGTGTATIGSNTSPVNGVNPAMFTGAITLNRATTFQSNNADRTTYLGRIGGNPGTVTITGSQSGTNAGGLNRTTWENDNTFTGNVVIAANSTLQVGTGAFAAPKNQIPDTADVTLNATSFLTLNGDSETIGSLNSTATNSQVQSAAGGGQSLRVMNGGTFNGIFNGGNNSGMTIEVAGGTLTLGGTVDNGTGRILVTAGTAVFNKASTTGVHASALDLTINTGGTAQISGTFGGTAPNYGTGVVLPANFRDQIFDGANGASSSVVINGGTLDLNGLSEGIGRLDGYGGLVTNSVAATTSTLFVGTASHSNLFTAGFNGNIADGAGSVALGKIGNGVAIFNGNLSHTGGTNVYAGALQIGNGGTTGTISGDVNLVNANAASLVINRGGNAIIPANVSGGGPVIINGTGNVFLTGNNTYTGTTTINDGILYVGNAGTSGTIGSGNITVHGDLAFNRSDAMSVSASIAGEGDVFQEGSGTTTYTGVATHTGFTTIDAGALLVNGSISGSTKVNGGVLGGSGTLGSVEVFGGTVAPGNSPGVLNTGNFTMHSGSTFAVEVDSLAGYDALNIAGTVNLGSATLSLGGSYLTPTVTNDLFFIVRNDSVDALTGTFLGLSEGSHVYAGNGQDYTISYFGDFASLSPTGGNDVVLTAVPEPGSVVMLIGGLAIFGVRRRRQA